METKITQEIIDKINKFSREFLDDYYKYQKADDFFGIDQILQVCQKQGLTVDQVPTLIEMQNVILMG